MNDLQTRVWMLELRLERALQSLRAAQAALKQAQEANRLGAVASAVGGGLSAGQRRAVASAGGIGAPQTDGTPGSGTITFKVRSGGKVTVGTETATAYNDWPAAVPGSAELTVEQVYGDGDWFVTGWWCP